ncbi:MAG TPA: serine hydrolase, partial [Rhodospirillaceae bacterium]|nr:serine hydrolase [Rhodospirillaceae bacterium]
MEQVNPETLGLNAAQLARIGEHLRGRYLEPGKLPGSVTLVARYGRVGLLDVAGLSDIERDTPMSVDTIFRIYSMSKPITSVALMMLYERGLFSLDDPVHRFIPEWRELAVRTAGAFPLFAT